MGTSPCDYNMGPKPTKAKPKPIKAPEKVQIMERTREVRERHFMCKEDISVPGPTRQEGLRFQERLWMTDNDMLLTNAERCHVDKIIVGHAEAPRDMWTRSYREFLSRFQ